MPEVREGDCPGPRGHGLRRTDLALVLLVAVVSALPWAWATVDADEALWLYGTREWMRGAPTPFNAACENKPVVLYLLYRVCLGTPLGAIPGIRLAGLVVTAVTAVVLAWYVGTRWDRVGGVAAGVAYPLALLLIGPQGFLTEHPQAMFTVIAVVLYALATERASKGFYVLSGLAWGLAATSKQPAVLALLVFLGLTLAGYGRSRSLRSRCADTALVLGASLMVPALFLGWLWYRGGPGITAEWVQISMPFSGTNAGIGMAGRVLGLVSMIIHGSRLAPILLLAIVPVFSSQGRGRVAALIVWAGVELVSYVVPGTGFQHQLIPYAAALAALAGVGASMLASWEAQRRALVASLGVSAAVLLVGLMLSSLLLEQQSNSPFLCVRSASAQSSTEFMGEWLAAHTTREDCVLASHGGVWYADRRLCSRYTRAHLLRPTPVCARFCRRFTEDLHRTPPKFVVLTVDEDVGGYPELEPMVRRDYRRVVVPGKEGRGWQVYERASR